MKINVTVTQKEAINRGIKEIAGDFCIDPVDIRVENEVPFDRQLQICSMYKEFFLNSGQKVCVIRFLLNHFRDMGIPLGLVSAKKIIETTLSVVEIYLKSKGTLVGF